MDKQSLPPSFVSDAAQQHTPRFTVTYCKSCGYRQRAVKIAAEVEELLQESTAFIEGINGVFEVKDRDVVIFSNKESGRFPNAGEIASIAKALDSGASFEIAKAQFAAKAISTESFEAWFLKAYGKPKKRFTTD